MNLEYNNDFSKNNRLVTPLNESQYIKEINEKISKLEKDNLYLKDILWQFMRFNNCFVNLDGKVQLNY